MLRRVVGLQSSLSPFLRVIRFVGDSPLPSQSNTPQTIDISIIEEDEDFFFVHKPSNVSMEAKQDFHVAIQNFGRSKYNFEPRVLFPLEKASSGITVFAKTYTAERHFFKSLSQGSTDNFVLGYYAAVTLINDSKIKAKPSGSITGGLMNTKKGGNKSVLAKSGGKPCITSYQSLGRTTYSGLVSPQPRTKPEPSTIEALLLALTPITLRGYQLRASCFSLNAPIIGDKRYASLVKTKEKQIFLHFGYLSFPGRHVNKCYQVKVLPSWDGLFKENITNHLTTLPKARRTNNNFLSSKRPKY